MTLLTRPESLPNEDGGYTNSLKKPTLMELMKA